MEGNKKEPMVSMYDPAADAFREVPLSLAEKFLGEVDNLKAGIKEARIEVEKERLYNQSKEKNDEQSK